MAAVVLPVVATAGATLLLFFSTGIGGVFLLLIPLAVLTLLPVNGRERRGLAPHRRRCSLYKARSFKKFRDRKLFMVSDLHLGDGTRCSDLFRGSDEDFIRFCDHVASEGQGLVIAGDAFDLDQCPDPYRIVHAHRPVIHALRRLACKVPVLLLPGNHDPAIPDDIMPEVARSPRILAEGRLLVEHGHLFDDHTPPGRFTEITSRVHRVIEKFSRTRIDVPLEKFDNTPNRVVHWAVYRGGLLVGKAAEVVGRLGWDGPRRAVSHVVDYWNRSAAGDPNGLVEKAVRSIEGGLYQAIVLGHSHEPGLIPVGTGFYANLGSWTAGDATFGEWDGKRNRMRVLDWRSHAEYGPERYEGFLLGNRKTFYDWWSEHYRGWLRFEFVGRPLQSRSEPT